MMDTTIRMEKETTELLVDALAEFKTDALSDEEKECFDEIREIASQLQLLFDSEKEE